MEIIPASRFSFEELTQAYNQTRVDYIVPMPMSVGRLREYARRYDVDLDASCVVVDEDDVLGLGMLGVRPGRAWITRLGVMPHARRRGAGGALMDGLIASAQERDLNRIWLEVIEGNAPAYQMFRRYQFEETRQLMVVRRPPTPRAASQLAEEVEAAVQQVTPLNHEEALILLAHRSRRPNWLNETESLQHVHNLMGLSVVLRDGGRGWVTYHAGLMQLTHIIVGVSAGDPAEVTTAVLRVLHHRHPNQDTFIENIPDDDRWPGYQRLGYFDTFRRIEMVRGA